jgi:light-regulated signal transduction histidine kinase (bacteriophytochrome)
MNYVPAMILLKDHEFRTIFANDNLQRLFPVEKWFGRKPHEIYHEELANLINAQDRMAMEQGYVSYEEVRTDRLGNPGIYFTQKFRIDMPGAEPLMGAIITDITEQKKAEEHIHELNASLELRVQERTAELQEANKELEAFAYTVSHDLRAPVRAIGGFTRILMDDYSGKLDTEGQRICRVITENTRRMEHLIDDLLSFSRLSRVDMNLSTIDMAEIVWKCFEEQTGTGDSSRIKLTVGEMPYAKGDYPMLVQVWSNLLSNALKYTSHCKLAEITVGSYREGAQFVYFIRDNGTGFDMKYANKLFGVFQRLHSAKEYEGTGVGLAIVHRILQRHGGKIWADAEIEKGATFSFTLTS